MEEEERAAREVPTVDGGGGGGGKEKEHDLLRYYTWAYFTYYILSRYSTLLLPLISAT